MYTCVELFDNFKLYTMYMYTSAYGSASHAVLNRSAIYQAIHENVALCVVTS